MFKRLKHLVSIAWFFIFIILFSIKPVYGDELTWGLLNQVNVVSQKVVSLFPKVEVYVISVDRDNIILDNTKGNLIEGMVLDVFRAGKEYIHPITGEVLGRTEGLAAKVQIEKGGDSLVRAKIVKRGMKYPVERGQKARITSGRLRVLLSNIKNNLVKSHETGNFRSLLASALEKTDRFDIIPMVDMYYTMKKHGSKGLSGILEHSFAQEAAVDLKADVLIECEINEVENLRYLKYRIFMPDSTTMLFQDEIKMTRK